MRRSAIHRGLLWGVALGAACYAARSHADDSDALRGKYTLQFQALADKCDALGRGDPPLDLSAQARITRGWLAPRDPLRQYAFLPGQPFPDKTPATAVDFWQANFLKIRRAYAAELFAQAEAAHSAGRATTAYRLLHEVLREDPSHATARAMLLPVEADAGIEVRRPDAGEALLDWKSREYWRVASPHFEILTNVARGDEARQIAQRLEDLHTVWRQLFFDYWSDSAEGAFNFQTRTVPAPRAAGRHRVVVFRDKQEYVVRLTALGVPGVGISEGFYSDDQTRSFFYAGDESAFGTWYHETTHQLFQETGTTVAGVAADGHVWFVEGVAMYMESLHARDGCVAVGGFDARRLQYARYRRLVDGFHVPLAELTQLGRKQLAGHEEIAQLYSEACGLTHFLLDYDGGKYRTGAIGLLRDIYAGRAAADALATRTGASLEQLDAQYAEFLADVDDHDLAEFLSPPERITALVLPRSKVTDAGVAHLARCTNLEWLDLSGTGVSDAGVAQLARATKLTRLSLRQTAITDAALETIAGFTQLDDLNLAHTKITDGGVPRLAGLRKLTALWLEGDAVGDAALATIGMLRTLELLDLAATRVTDKGLLELSSLLKLRALYLSHTELTDAGLPPLKRLQALEHLQLDGTKVSPAGADGLKAALKNTDIILRLE